MRKGKITFAWSPEEESELNLPVKPPVKPVVTKTATTTKPAFDVSKIRDRVMQMEMGEEVILDGEALESLEAEEAQEEDDRDEALAQAPRIKQAKEARAKSRSQDPPEDYIPFATDHRLKRDFEAAEEFTAHQSSRLIREDLLNDQDDSSAIEGFTKLPGLSRRLLERDLKSTEFYDSELRELHAEDSNDDDDDGGSSWQATQARKGIEKGWRSAGSGAYDADEFLAKHSRLALQFTPPKPIDAAIPIDTLLTEEQSRLAALKAELTAIEQNCAKMRLDVEGYDFGRFDTEADKARLGELRSLATFTAKWSAFLTEREAELEALSSQCQPDTDNNALVLDAWEHFFDDVEAEELLDLPGACVRLRGEEESLVQIVGFFCKYHRLRVKLVPGVTEEEALESSGLQSIIESLSPTAQMSIKEKYLL